MSNQSWNKAQGKECIDDVDYHWSKDEVMVIGEKKEPRRRQDKRGREGEKEREREGDESAAAVVLQTAVKTIHYLG